MNIASILATKGIKVYTIGPGELIRQALRSLADHNVGALVVVDEAQQPVGIISERDIVREAARNERLFSRPVGEIMTKEVILAQPQDDLETVSHTMTEHRIRQPADRRPRGADRHRVDRRHLEGRARSVRRRSGHAPDSDSEGDRLTVDASTG
jgi:signal-transduction protein with cAMP-binding, CBS, and nucleotidyltransferase domain